MASQLSEEIFPTSRASQYHNHHHDHQPMRAATPLTKVRVPKAEVSRSTPRISTKAGGVTAHLRRETSKSSHMSHKWCTYHYIIIEIQNQDMKAMRKTYQAERKKPNMADTTTKDLGINIVTLVQF